MLKLRLKRTGRKGSPSYRLVIMENTARRDGKSIDEVGYYNPITKVFRLEKEKLKKWLNYGVQPTHTVLNLLTIFQGQSQSINSSHKLAKFGN